MSGNALQDLNVSQLLEREEWLLNMLKESESQTPELAAVQPQLAVPVPTTQPVIDLGEEEVVETVYLENRVTLATTYNREITTTFVLKDNLPEYQRLMQEYEEAVADVVNADTATIEAAMKADEARRSLCGFRSKISAAETEVATARRLLEEAQGKLVEAEEASATVKADYLTAQSRVVETIRKSEEANSRADSATFRAMALANKASRYLLDQEINAAERARMKAERRAEGMCGVFGTVDEIDAARALFRVPFAFKAKARQSEVKH